MVNSLPARRHLSFDKTYRLIPSHYPPIDVFEDIADPALWELIVSAETKLNPRVRDVVGDLSLVPANRRVSGPGASWVMAAFTHVSTERPSRFSDGGYGVYYAGDCFEVALAETIYHFERRMQATVEPPMIADYRVLTAAIIAELDDIRENGRFDEYLDPDPRHWGRAQAFARTLRDEHASNGIVYPSVRHPLGGAIAAFWPDVVGPATPGQQYGYHWNGERVDRYIVYGDDEWTVISEK